MAYSTLIDIGVVTSIQDNFATVKSVRLLNGMNVVYNDVEVLYPSGIRTDIINATVLLFVPVSCVPDTSTMEPLQVVSPFDTKGMKAIPLTNSGKAVNVGLFSEGFHVLSKTYDFLCNNQGVRITSTDITAEITDSYLQLKAGTSVNFIISREGISKIINNENDALVSIEYTDSTGNKYSYFTPSGTLTPQQYADPSTYNGWKNVKIQHADGTIEWKRGTRFSIEINENNEIEMDINGTNLGIDSQGQVNVVSAGTTIKIDSAGMVEISNNTGSLGEMLGSLIDNIKGMDIVCPNGAGSVNPASQLALTTDKQKITSLLS